MAPMIIGHHLLADLFGIEVARLCDARLLETCLLEAAKVVHLTPIRPPVLHKFMGGGITGYLLLAESHIALHSYPEHNYIAIDIFSCGQGDARAAMAVFIQALQPSEQRITTLVRGTKNTTVSTVSHSSSSYSSTSTSSYKE